MLQLTDEECEILRCKSSASSWGGRRYNPYAFTEQGIYMLMTVLKGELATKQSKALIRIFKQMKDYIVDNQPLLGQREYLQLPLSLITKQPMSRFIIAVLHPKTEGIKLRPLQPLPMDAFIIP